MSEHLERRRYPRYRLWLPATLLVEEEEVDAVGHDMSRRGALFVCRVPVATDVAMRVVTVIPPDRGARFDVAARVLRCEANHEDPGGLWPFEVAVEFDEEQAPLEQQLHDLLAALRPIPE